MGSVPASFSAVAASTASTAAVSVFWRLALPQAAVDRVRAKASIIAMFLLMSISPFTSSKPCDHRVTLRSPRNGVNHRVTLRSRCLSVVFFQKCLKEGVPFFSHLAAGLRVHE